MTLVRVYEYESTPLFQIDKKKQRLDYIELI